MTLWDWAAVGLILGSAFLLVVGILWEDYES